MGLLYKMRVLVGALLHKPFPSRPERRNSKDEIESLHSESRLSQAPPDREGPQAVETERVADLIAGRRGEEGG